MLSDRDEKISRLRVIRIGRTVSLILPIVLVLLLVLSSLFFEVSESKLMALAVVFLFIDVLIGTKTVLIRCPRCEKPLEKDNDIIKALGYVALYAAYVEESVDVVMERLSLIKRISDKDRRKPTSVKIKWCIKIIEQLNSSELHDLINLLQKTADLLEQRNQVIHGRHYSHDDRSALLRSGRINDPDTLATPEEHYDLAENLFSMQAELPNQHYFATMRAISEAKGA